MFKQILPALLAGEFICPASDHDAFHYLSDSQHYASVDTYLDKMGLTLARTRHGGAFYCAQRDIHTADKKAARETFRQIKHSLRPIVSFLDMLMRATQRDDILEANALLEANQIMTLIDSNPSFRSELQSLVNQAGIKADSTDRNRLDKILAYFQNNGYLVLVNAEREIYKVTGKIEYILEVIEFLMEHEAVSDEEETETGIAGTVGAAHGSLL